MDTKITIVIPTIPTDRGYLITAIQSVLNQTVPVKLIVERSSHSCAWNLSHGVAKVDTPYYAILGDDDYFDNRFAETMLSAIGNADVCLCNAYQFTGNNIMCYTSRYNGLKELLNHNTIHGGAVLYRTETAKGKYDPHLYCAEEYDLHLRLAKGGALFSNVDYVGYYYRVHDNNKSKQLGENKENRTRQIEIIKNKYR
jgi:hypothetical protein